MSGRRTKIARTNKILIKITMNKTLSKMIGGLTLVLVFTGCKHDLPEYQPYTVTDEERVAYAEKTLYPH